MGKLLYIYPNNHSVQTELTIDIENLGKFDLSTNPHPLSFSFHYNEQIIIFFASESKEIVEWYEAITCTKFMLIHLLEDCVLPKEDMSEIHICNVKSSRHFIGDKLFEGYMRTESNFLRIL